MAIKPSLFLRWLQRQVDREVRTLLSESDSFFTLGSQGSASEIDRYAPDRDQLLGMRWKPGESIHLPAALSG